MKFDVKIWLEEISHKIIERFNNRVLFIGYHGSYKRGEATDNSDVDMVVILDELKLADLKEYKKIIQSMPYSEKACGFISGKKEIENWSKSDIFQFYFETEPLYGDLRKIVTPLSSEDIKLFIKSSSETLYHASCHSFLFDKNIHESFPSLLKMTFFILQAQYFLQNNKYIQTKKELINLLSGEDKTILEACIKRNSIKDYEVEQLYEDLIEWCSNKIKNN